MCLSAHGLLWPCALFLRGGGRFVWQAERHYAVVFSIEAGRICRSSLPHLKSEAPDKGADDIDPLSPWQRRRRVGASAFAVGAHRDFLWAHSL